MMLAKHYLRDQGNYCRTCRYHRQTVVAHQGLGMVVLTLEAAGTASRPSMQAEDTHSLCDYTGKKGGLRYH